MPTDHRPALLLANPFSRRGADGLAAVRTALDSHGIGVITPEWNRDKAQAVIAAHADRVQSVIVAGGDGSLNAAAPGLLATGLPLGIMPLGTANDLARTLGIPPDPNAAAAVIAAGLQRRIDIGMANDVPFFNIASIGFGVDLTRALTRDSKRRWGTLGYAIAAIRTIRRMRPFTARISNAGAVHTSRTIHLAVGNGRHYGGGMTIAGDARVDDQRLDVVSLEVSSLWHLLLLLPAFREGKHHLWKDIRTLAGEDIEVTTSRPRAVNTDGEITTQTPVRFTVRPGAITVFAPDPADTDGLAATVEPAAATPAPRTATPTRQPG